MTQQSGGEPGLSLEGLLESLFGQKSTPAPPEEPTVETLNEFSRTLGERDITTSSMSRHDEWTREKYHFASQGHNLYNHLKRQDENAVVTVQQAQLALAEQRGWDVDARHLLPGPPERCLDRDEFVTAICVSSLISQDGPLGKENNGLSSAPDLGAVDELQEAVVEISGISLPSATAARLCKSSVGETSKGGALLSLANMFRSVSEYHNLRMSPLACYATYHEDVVEAYPPTSANVRFRWPHGDAGPLSPAALARQGFRRSDAAGGPSDGIVCTWCKIFLSGLSDLQRQPGGLASKHAKESPTCPFVSDGASTDAPSSSAYPRPKSWGQSTWAIDEETQLNGVPPASTISTDGPVLPQNSWGGHHALSSNAAASGVPHPSSKSIPLRPPSSLSGPKRVTVASSKKEGVIDAEDEAAWDKGTSALIQRMRMIDAPVLAYLDELICEAEDIEVDGGKPGRRRSSLYDQMAGSPPGGLKQDGEGERRVVHAGNPQQMGR